MACKLSVLLADNAPKAVILRRGPSKLVQLILWHTDTDEIEFGQWFKGRIYAGACDLSPGGSLFVYLAAKWNRFTMKDLEYTYAWTAVSRPPWLTALALFPAVEREREDEHGMLLQGGGLFLDDKTLWLNHKPELAKAHPDHPPKGLEIIVEPYQYGEIERRRLARDGWIVVQEGTRRVARSGWRHWILEKGQGRDNGKTLIWDIGNKYTYFLRNDNTGKTRLLEAADWADWDQMGRLVITNGCTLLSARAEDNFDEFTTIADFGSQTFTPIVAPDWATQW